MSRSASLTLNLLISLAEVNGIEFPSGMGTHYNPADRSIRHVPTDKIRHLECAEMVDLCREPFGIRLLGDVRSGDLFRSILAKIRCQSPSSLQASGLHLPCAAAVRTDAPSLE